MASRAKTESIVSETRMRHSSPNAHNKQLVDLNQHHRFQHRLQSIMCHRTQCSRCGKATWVGCGMHIEQALKGVKEEDRCPNYKHYFSLTSCTSKLEK
mmetsp:Transcript_4443/g.11667  ORF Transcript_4443/g.11667 Transcript_4443/m.11667 type:complete len:98 (+) Transcript_4443:568-861(+)